MRIARPPTGFNIEIPSAVRALVASRIEVQPDFELYWNDILDRLRMTAHIEGVPQENFGPGHRLWAAAADEAAGRPRVRVVYLVLGNFVRIKVVHIG